MSGLSRRAETVSKPAAMVREQVPLIGPGRPEGPDTLRTVAHILRGAFIILGAAVLVWALADAVLVIFLAVLMSTLLRGLATELHRLTRLPMTAAVLTVFFMLTVLVCGTLYWIGPRLADEGQQLWQQIAPQLGNMRGMLHRLGVGGMAEGGSSGGGVGSLPHMVELVASSTASFVGALLVIVATAVYLAVSPDLYINGAVRLTPRWYHARARAVILEMGHAMQGWLLGQLIDMIVVGVLVGGGLTLLNVPLALVLGVIAGLFTFVPYFGTIISAIPALLVGLTLGLHQMLWILGLFLLAHALEGYLISPFVQRRTVHLPPALTVLAMVVLTAFFGIFGVLIATPLIAVLLVGITRVYVEDVLGDRVPGQPGASTASGT